MSRPRKKRPGGTGLRFTRIRDFGLIPRRLVEQVEPRECDPDALCAWGPSICADPRTLLGVFADAKDLVRGFLWATVNPLDRRIHVQMLSVDEEFRGRGIVREAKGILDRVKSETGAVGLVFRTTRPELFTGLGFIPSETLIMEEKQDGRR